MSDAVALQHAGLPPIRLPTVSYGPLRLMEAVPWLMFATAMRIISVQGGLVALTAMLCANLSIFLALMLAARRMIELTDGTTGLGKLEFGEQLGLARRVMKSVLLFMAVAAVAVMIVGAPWTGAHMLLGFDGIAFDQFTYFGMTWSALLAALTLLLLLRVESGGSSSLKPVFRELWERSVCMVPAIVAVAAAHVGLSLIQGVFRVFVFAYWHSTATPQLGRTMVYFFFIFGFASIRLWITLAILVFALRESYRRGQGTPLPVAAEA